MIVFSRVHATLSVRRSVGRLRGFPGEAGGETRYVGRTCQGVSVYQISTISRGWFLRNVHLIVFSRVHATVSVRRSVRRLRGFPGEAGDETRYVGRTCQEVFVYQI